MKKRIQSAKVLVFTVLIAASIISAQATIHSYTVSFGPEAVGATGSGTGSLFYDDVAHSLQLQANFSGLSGNVTQTHFHGPTATPGTGTFGIAVGNPSLPGFPLGANNGNYTQTLDLTQTSVYNGTFLANNGGTAAGAEVAFFNAMNEGRIYWNIHSSTFGGGEIRGFVTLVPEPSTFALAGLGVLGVAARIWSKRRAKIS
jgi:hypothetical protein